MTSQYGGHFKLREFSYSLRFARYLFAAPSAAFSYIFSLRKERLVRWERRKGRERELVAGEEFELRERLLPREQDHKLC